MNQSQPPLPSPILYCPCPIQTGQERQSVELSNTAYLTDFLHLLGKFSNSRAQVVKIGHRFIVYSISAFFITDNTFRYNRESARSIRIPSFSLLISRRSSSAHVEQLPSVVTRSRLASKHAREFGEEQGLGTKRVKRKNLDSLLSSPWTGAISWVPRRFWNEDSWLPFSP